uniref:Uncharacterized protein n=1 Tax=Pasiphaea japonica whispovirus TaxID=2984286 RepID=A0A9C7BXF4_9VIRU|nr:MAG: hypothetical protein [Pasiphaea japonica whispovirus]
MDIGLIANSLGAYLIDVVHEALRNNHKSGRITSKLHLKLNSLLLMNSSFFELKCKIIHTVYNQQNECNFSIPNKSGQIHFSTLNNYLNFENNSKNEVMILTIIFDDLLKTNKLDIQMYPNGYTLLPGQKYLYPLSTLFNCQDVCVVFVTKIKQ